MKHLSAPRVTSYLLICAVLFGGPAAAEFVVYGAPGDDVEVDLAFDSSRERRVMVVWEHDVGLTNDQDILGEVISSP